MRGNRQGPISCVVAALVTCHALNAAADEFLDDFSTPGFAYEAAGIAWNPGNSTPGEGEDPLIVTEPPCDSACVKFEFTGSTNLSDDGYSELSLTLVPGANELSVEWRQYFPTDWQHRNSFSNNKNEFLIMHTAQLTETTGLTVEANFDLAGNQQVVAVRSRIGNDSSGSAFDTIATGPGVIPDKLREWLPVRAYIKLSSSDTAADGELRLSIGAQEVVNRNNLRLGTAPIDVVQFMGRAHSGFYETSITYIDDVRVARATAPPVPQPPTLLETSAAPRLLDSDRVTSIE